VADPYGWQMPAEPLTREHVARLKRELPFSELVALSLLANRCGAAGACKATLREIGDPGGLNEDVVRRAIREAADAGLLSVEPKAALQQRSAKLSLAVTFASPEIADALWIHRFPDDIDDADAKQLDEAA
jgi:hypothetical protein